MDTPERNQIGTPISKMEESPFSSFINNLSPINPTKATHVSQTFSSLSFTSPPSVFTSPHVSLQKDYKFLRRHQVSDLAKSPFALEAGNKDSVAKEVVSSGHLSDSLEIVQVRGETASGSEDSAKPLEENTDCAKELPRVLKYDIGSPRCKTAVTSSGNETNCEPDASAALVQYVQEPSVRGSFGTELNSQVMNHDNEETCDWQSLISGSSDLFIFDSPNIATSKESVQKSEEKETNVFTSLLSRFPHDEAFSMQTTLHDGSSNCNEAYESIENSTQPTEAPELKQMEQPPETLEISSVNELLCGDSVGKKGKQPFSNLHRGLRRRCLTFEIPRTKKSIDSALFSSSLSSLQSEEKPLSCIRQPITPGNDSSRRILPGIGLHLNALAAASKDCSNPNQEIISPTAQDPFMKSLDSSSLRKDEGPAENVAEIAENSSQASVYAAIEELNPNSPKKKRRKFETIGEGESCKRCNCKKSKCLKLYCECFAAGVYCVEPCSCQDCFNKPIHEETVLATRKQIESRNPLAFAPKVIRTTDSVQELGEDTTRTPASARHKRGCNCKKSNCLKKYCECYQGGVGCSINCRCEGCKNAFGRKDGSTMIATEAEIEKLQASEKSMMDKSSDIHRSHDEDDQHSEFSIPQTPSRLYRPLVPLATSSKGKPPRSSLAMSGLSSSLHPVDGPGRSTFLRSQSCAEKHHHSVSVDEIPAVLQNTSPPSSGLKTLSPNSKRVLSPHNANGQSHGLRSSRKLILQSIPAFPSLSPRR